MDVYFVRHGETAGNRAMRLQSDKSDLTERGEAQALATAKILKAVNPTHLISSTMVRALETTRLIECEVDLIPATSELFKEIGRPHRLEGRRLLGPISLMYYMLWYFGLVKKEDDTSESYADVRSRIDAARDFLMAYPNDARVVVVSHSVFITFFLAHVCRQRPLYPWEALWHFIKIVKIKNGAIRKLTVDTRVKNACAWELQQTRGE
jgi:broad specificity phosphatase PhoE